MAPVGDKKRKRASEAKFEIVSKKEQESSAPVPHKPEHDQDQEDFEVPVKKSKTVANTTTSDAFSSAVNALLDTHLKAHDRSTPILARSKHISKNLESEKLLQKAKRSILHEKKLRLTMNHQTNVLAEGNESLLKEKKLKKIAQRGTIKLFNAIAKAQTVGQDPSAVSVRGVKAKKDIINELSKDVFLDMVQQEASK